MFHFVLFGFPALGFQGGIVEWVLLDQENSHSNKRIFKQTPPL
jgi:hypothetical protein